MNGLKETISAKEIIVTGSVRGNVKANCFLCTDFIFHVFIFVFTKIKVKAVTFLIDIHAIIVVPLFFLSFSFFFFFPLSFFLLLKLHYPEGESSFHVPVKKHWQDFCN